MDKLKMQSPNKVDKNIESIGKLFPNCIVETKNEKGEIEQAIDFDLLRQELSKNIVEGNKERYQFTWPDKKKSILLANSPIEKTLRPCREESVDFDNTENLYIEGDNLDVLKLLQETYLNKVKMIYIDPPYNTGNDFVYEDNFAKSEKEHSENSGEYDEEGNRLFQNTERNGRFHTDWLNMIYPRIKVAKDLLTEDGVIFISIDDHEQANIRKICDEIFGEKNFVANICHKSRASISNDKIISSNHNHILLIAKNIDALFNIRSSFGLKPKLEGFKNKDKRGYFKLVPVDGPGGAKKGNPHYEFMGIEGYWRFSKQRMERMYKEGLIVKTTNNLQQKLYLDIIKNTRRTVSTWWDEKFYTANATIELKKLMGNKSFDTPKPIELVIKMIELSTNNNNNSIILDFFSGSATTAHAVMKLNAEDGGHRKFIMVQLPEKTDEKSEAYKAGNKNICEIEKERIRRAGKKIVEELEKKKKDNKIFDKEDNYKLDTGFRVLKLDSTNMKDVYYDPSKYTPELFSSLTDNIKDDRTPEDLLFQVMLELGVPLSYKIDETTINDKKVFNVNNNYLIACFDDNITDETVKYIAKLKPLYAVFRDSSMASDSVATNFEQLFKTYSPETIRKVL